MEKLLANQVALVTGASSGIGYGVARALASAGAAVVLNYHSHADEAEQLAAEIEKTGGAAIAVQADVSDPVQVENMFNACRARFETVDIVVANSGLQKDSAFAEMTLEQWQTVLATNLTGTIPDRSGRRTRIPSTRHAFRFQSARQNHLHEFRA